MGLFFNEDRKVYLGKYKGIDVWTYGSQIGHNWYGDYYVTIPRGKTKRRMKVKDSICRSVEDIEKYIDEHLETLKQ